MHVVCGDLRIGLDSPAGDIAFLSHAHSDHTSGLKRKKKFITAPETLELAGLTGDSMLVAEDWLRNAGCRMLDAGHILGSRQLLVENETEGVRTVYTGDISLEPNIFGWKAEIPQCDHLIMEATYGDPQYVFPDSGEVHRSIEKWVKANDKKNLLIGAYELGKAQILIRMLNEHSIVPLVTEKTESFCEIYDKYGAKLDRIAVGSEGAESALNKPFVAVVPMTKAKRYFASRLAEAYGRETLCAVATGWALKYRFDADAAFPVSDHADFDDLVSYIEQSGAKKVEFFCGDGSKILDHIKNQKLVEFTSQQK